MQICQYHTLYHKVLCRKENGNMEDQNIREITELKRLILKSLRDSDLPYMRKVYRLWGITTAIGFLFTHFLYTIRLYNSL